MKTFRVALVSRVLLLGAAAAGCGSFLRTDDPATISVRTERVAGRIRARVKAAGEPINQSVDLPAFYERRFYRPAWSDERGPSRLADDLVAALRQSEREGLRPDDYQIADIEAALAAARDTRRNAALPLDQLAQLDLLLTDAFLRYGSHLFTGHVNPDTLRPEWLAQRRSGDIAAALERALTTRNIAGTLDKLRPRQAGYGRLREALARYRAVAAAGGWEPIPAGPMLRRGDRGAAVRALRQRLRVEDSRGLGQDDDLFDEDVEQALMIFQRRHGLAPDGRVGAATRTELNVRIERRIEQLALNLERWRWLPEDLGRRHILVNIPAFQLEVVDDQEVVLAMRVVVGRSNSRTPVFSDTIRYLVLNPYWNVPRDIAAEELLPKVQEDLSYLGLQGLRVLSDSGPDAREIDPTTVDWAAITSSDFSYRLRQDPGPLNALGRVKFMFPNKFNVYLHDTPQRALFEATERGLSHGCIRVERPIELAVYLLRQARNWNRDAVLRALGEAVDLEVLLPEPIPVHLLYWTAWADEDGTVQFRRDIHDRDVRLLTAFRAQPATTE